MSWDLGDVVPLSITVKNPAGGPDNAGNVSLLITLPDGSTVTQASVGPTTLGHYDFDYPSVQAGRHAVYWQATGTNASAFSDAFDVVPPDSGAFISLADARQHLRMTSSEDDEQLRWFVDTSCQMIADRMGAVVPAAVTEDCSGRCTIVLERRPVLSITSVQRLPGLAAIPAADRAAGVGGWYLDSSEGVLKHTSTFGGDVRVLYRVGRTPLPSNFRLAGLELIAHLWRGSQHNQAGGRPALGPTDAISATYRPYAMPYRVMELLGLKKDQERDEPLIG